MLMEKATSGLGSELREVTLMKDDGSRKHWKEVVIAGLQRQLVHVPGLKFRERGPAPSYFRTLK
jgi:hypothetical protein